MTSGTDSSVRPPRPGLPPLALPDPTAQTSRVVLGLVLFAAAHAALLVISYRDLFMHPHNVTFHYRITLRDGLGLTSDLFLKPFAFTSVEFRPRFLMYFSLFLEQKIRYALYGLVPPHPSASILWPLTLVATPYLLHRFLLRITGQRQTAMIGLALLLSAVGYLSMVTVNFTPAKPMSLFFFVAILNVAMTAHASLGPGDLLYRARTASTALLLGLLLASLLFDEASYVLYLVVPVLFPGMFIDLHDLRTRGLSAVRRTAGNAVLFAAPGALFLLFALVVAPIITRHVEGYRFDVLSPLKTEGYFHHFAPGNVYRNAMSLVGTSFVPRQVSPLIAVPPNPNVWDQRVNLPKVAILILVAALAASILWSGRRSIPPLLPRLGLAFSVFLLWHTLIQSFHVPVVNGYIYGSLYAPFFAVIFAIILGIGMQQSPGLRRLALGVLVVVVAVQIDNFRGINRSQVDFHTSDKFIGADIRRDLPDLHLQVDWLRRPTYSEALNLWRCWRQADGLCDVFSRPVSRGVVYLLAEFHVIDRARAENATRPLPTRP